MDGVHEDKPAGPLMPHPAFILPALDDGEFTSLPNELSREEDMEEWRYSSTHN
jgi:hypothetical protein